MARFVLRHVVPKKGSELYSVRLSDVWLDIGTSEALERAAALKQ